ncbi:MAG: SAM-dependent chlorinase/fluorinase [Calditrichaeota bacterium]|nr:SAM-dependent chlorinase/fluorinase [Calditrichota bacterium]HQU70960.1 SAM-dependent chlorinase/fluorinase [Calditrichia bacterium]
MPRKGTIALITDFATVDGYVGAMKGRIKSLAPRVEVIDITHQIEPFNLRQAAFCLQNSYPYFPDKTVFVVVVDPGVGTSRRGMVIKSSQHYFIGPDNGVFSFVFQREGCRSYAISLDAFHEEIADTFHGRDVFAPLAAKLACGKDILPFLEPLQDPVSFLNSPRQIDDNQLMLEVLHTDHFGNLILNFSKSDWILRGANEDLTVVAGQHRISGIQKTFGEVAAGETLITWDSTGFLQLAVNMGNAAKELNIHSGEKVRLEL